MLMTLAMMVMTISSTIISKQQIQTALARVLDELERIQEKGKSSGYNFQDNGHISLGPVVYF